ncbi:MAG: glycogen/starch synthase, partial [Bacteroidales bacterium]|nr:glycogen/starch synthase [Bacteroidales bacterium]
MKVLMFGWEFPPHISGGLGTACYGLTKALLKQGVDVLFVVPKLHGDEDRMSMKMFNASDVTINFKDILLREYWEKFSYLEVGSRLVPYTSPEAFEKSIESEARHEAVSENTIYSKQYSFSGKYGPNLMEEVARYALVASQIAMENDFDVIHAHDWLTYPAGIAAKKISGKPLVVHMHATEFDRSGENINEIVYNIEKDGMMAADAVITVSHFTRNIVLSRYGIE